MQALETSFLSSRAMGVKTFQASSTAHKTFVSIDQLITP